MSTYKIHGMTCQGCVNAVTKALTTALPETKIEVRLETHQIHIEGTHDAKTVEDTVETAGFDYDGPAS